MGRGGRFALAWGFAATTATLTGTAWAQLGPDGSPITTNDYSIDLSQGPVLASTRVIGLGGAYVAVAEFVEGNTQNPAAPAVRPWYSYDHLDWDLGLGVTFPSTITGSDFFNTGKERTSIPTTEHTGFVFLELAGNLQFGKWGLGVGIAAQQYDLARSDDVSDRLTSNFGRISLQLARNFMNDELVVGVGFKSAGLTVINQNAANDADGTLFDSAGSNYEIGGLYRPSGQSFRVGAAFSGPITSRVDEAATSSRVVFPGTPDELYLPDSVKVPWELNLGVAYQFGRMFNPPWDDPEELAERTARYIEWRREDRDRRRRKMESNARAAGGDVEGALAAIEAQLADESARDDARLEQARELTRQRLKERNAELGRFYVLVTTALLVNGPTSNSVGVESFLERTVSRSGETTTFSPRLGLESEVLPHYIVLRAGTYFEPTRFSSNPRGGRVHGTMGGDVKLGNWSVFEVWPEEYVWRLRGAVDAARDYFGWGVAIGGWY